MRISDWSSDVCSSDLLDLAKVEAGKLDLRHDAVRVDALFETCSRLMDERAAGAGVSLVIEPTQVPVLFADDTRLRQILLNLLSNAIKFTPGGGTVLLRALTTPEGGCELQVEDNGIGMTEAEISLALQPFTQIDTSLSRRFEGTGLGLPLTKALVELHRGELKLRSQRGVGTIASICLPQPMGESSQIRSEEHTSELQSLMPL